MVSISCFCFCFCFCFSFLFSFFFSCSLFGSFSFSVYFSIIFCFLSPTPSQIPVRSILVFVFVFVSGNPQHQLKHPFCLLWLPMVVGATNEVLICVESEQKSVHKNKIKINDKRKMNSSGKSFVEKVF